MKRCLFIVALLMCTMHANAQTYVDKKRIASAEWVLYISKLLDPEFMVRIDDDNRVNFPYVFSEAKFTNPSDKQFSILLKGAQSKTYEIKARMSKNTLQSKAHDSIITVGSTLNGLKLTDKDQIILSPAKNITVLSPPNRVDPLGYSIASGQLGFKIDKLTKATDPTVNIKPKDLPLGVWEGDIEFKFTATWPD